ncbi:hypothetical protein Ga0609869_000925 [Rhodovulum iodosum]|uniref:Hedgehog/Intein (Hint) domain-containing protein n=1 Tax=Rhodovulum iodosum TaxID=68291 RepID=A0ABV3XT14_9RHOB|nr:Hint domain-containing protein [Rhodovulum robiginosum]RSK32989.1 hypothetical protein EJA01_11800 [Rhodovulum robiginosum]
MARTDIFAAEMVADYTAPKSSAFPAARGDRRPPRSAPLMRRYEISGITAAGEVVDFIRRAPATPAFEDAFAAFARGTLIATPAGPVAIEDLHPGMAVETAAGARQLMWVGSTVFYPRLPDRPENALRLTRFTTDSMGFGRPSPDLVLGPRARLLFRHEGCEDMLGSPSAVAPATAFVDGISTVAVNPAAPLTVFHLALAGQQILLANGVEVESFHPGPTAGEMMDFDTRTLFLSLFPHVETLADFGPMTLPRLTAFEFEQIRNR